MADRRLLADLNTLSLPRLFQELVAGDAGVQRLLELAFAEDLAEAGDVTSASIVDAAASGRATLATRTPGVVAGLPLVPELLEAGDTTCRFAATVEDGSTCAAGDALGTLSGPLRDVLRVERVLLNMLGRACGVATATRRFVDAAAGSGAVICDTRKTIPGWRRLDKYAVRCGGGVLHRIGLFDAVMYKDNHLAGVEPRDLGRKLNAAVERARVDADVRYVAVEVDDLEQLDRVLELPSGVVDVVLLDNFDRQQLVEAVRRRGRCDSPVQLEASGGITLETVRAVAATGVDRISVGALTHSAPSLDLGLDMQMQ